MARMLRWIWRYLIVGQPIPRQAKCARWEGHRGAAKYCELGLCTQCCEERCNCLVEVVRSCREMRG